MTAEAELILTLVKGHAITNPIPRPVLLFALQIRGFVINDRRMRAVIANLRRTPAGAMISTAAGGGYFWAESRAQMDAALVRDERRFRRLAKRIAAQRKLAGLDCAPELLAIAGGEA